MQEEKISNHAQLMSVRRFGLHGKNVDGTLLKRRPHRYDETNDVFTEQEQFFVIGRDTMRIHFIETHSSTSFRWYVLMSVVGLFAINTSVVADVSAHAQQPSPITSKLKKMTLETEYVPGSVVFIY